MDPALVIVFIVGALLGGAWLVQRTEASTEIRIEAYELWKRSGTISMSYIKRYPAMARDLERRSSQPSVYAAYRQHVASSPAPMYYAEWLHSEGYE